MNQQAILAQVAPGTTKYFNEAQLDQETLENLHILINSGQLILHDHRQESHSGTVNSLHPSPIAPKKHGQTTLVGVKR